MNTRSKCKCANRDYLLVTEKNSLEFTDKFRCFDSYSNETDVWLYKICEGCTRNVELFIDWVGAKMGGDFSPVEMTIINCPKIREHFAPSKIKNLLKHLDLHIGNIVVAKLTSIDVDQMDDITDCDACKKDFWKDYDAGSYHPGSYPFQCPHQMYEKEVSEEEVSEEVCDEEAKRNLRTVS